MFHCQHPTASDLEWLLNGSSTSLGRPDIQFSTIVSGDGISEQLMIETQIEHNQTSIECVAKFSDGSLPMKTLSVTLGVQGIYVVERSYSVRPILNCICMGYHSCMFSL